MKRILEKIYNFDHGRSQDFLGGEGNNCLYVNDSK